MDNYFRGATTPVKEEQTVELKCVGIGERGDGIFKIDKFVIIVPGTEINKSYRIIVKKVKSTLAFGEVVEEVEN